MFVTLQNLCTQATFTHILCPQVIGSGSLVGVVVAACVALTLLYAVILLVWILWNKR